MGRRYRIIYQYNHYKWAIKVTLSRDMEKYEGIDNLIIDRATKQRMQQSETFRRQANNTNNNMKIANYILRKEELRPYFGEDSSLVYPENNLLKSNSNKFKQITNL